MITETIHTQTDLKTGTELFLQTDCFQALKAKVKSTMKEQFEQREQKAARKEKSKAALASTG